MVRAYAVSFKSRITLHHSIERQLGFEILHSIALFISHPCIKCLLCLACVHERGPLRRFTSSVEFVMRLFEKRPPKAIIARLSKG